MNKTLGSIVAKRLSEKPSILDPDVRRVEATKIVTEGIELLNSDIRANNESIFTNYNEPDNECVDYKPTTQELNSTIAVVESVLNPDNKSNVNALGDKLTKQFTVENIDANQGHEDNYNLTNAINVAAVQLGSKDKWYAQTHYPPGTMTVSIPTSIPAVKKMDGNRSNTGDSTLNQKIGLADFHKKPYEIAGTSTNEIIPVKLTVNKDKFVDSAIVKDTPLTNHLGPDGNPYKTNFLKTSSDYIDILGLGSSLQIHNNNSTSSSDVIHSAKLSKILVAIDGKHVVLNISGAAGQNGFDGDASGDNVRSLKIESEFTLYPKTKTADGGVLGEDFALFNITGVDSITMNMEINGTLHTSDGIKCSSGGASISTSNLNAIAKNKRNMIKTLISGTTLVGIKTESYKSNTILSNPGVQITEINTKSKISLIPTIPFANTEGKINLTTGTMGAHQNDYTTPTALMELSSSASGLTELLSYFEQNSEENRYNKVSTIDSGIGFAKLLKRTTIVRELNLSKIVVTDNTTEALPNVGSGIINAIHVAVTDLMSKSNFYSAINSMNKVSAQKPLVTIIVDNRYATILNLRGEANILGDKFNVEIHGIEDDRMRNKIIFAPEYNKHAGIQNSLTLVNEQTTPPILGQYTMDSTKAVSCVIKTQHFLIHTGVAGMFTLKEEVSDLLFSNNFSHGGTTVVKPSEGSTTTKPEPTPTPTTGD